MHELSIARAIVDSTTRHAGGRPVTAVTVRIGHLRQVVPDALQFNWDVLTDHGELQECVLVIEEVPAVVECRACGARTTLGLPVLSCGACESFDVTLLSGEEFLIASMDVVEV
ncbi:MAG: hydrogenase maturation nickel metallochaperone HypA [Acidimicrobiales bacterium]